MSSLLLYVDVVNNQLCMATDILIQLDFNAMILYHFSIYFLQTLETRVESGSDDLDYLGHFGHFFGGSSRSHPQTKLSGCDPDF